MYEGMREVISVAIHSTCARLGYVSLKPCQENAVKAFISAPDLHKLLVSSLSFFHFVSDGKQYLL